MTGPTKTDLLESLIIEVLNTFFALRQKGRDLEMVSESGGGLWGLMRLLRMQGPQTLSDVARLRGVSRQYIQKIAAQLADEGLIRMTANPRDRRSRLMVLTARGEARFAELDKRFTAMVQGLAPTFSTGELKTAARTVASLRAALEDGSDQSASRQP